MKKFIALLISASLMVAPIAFADHAAPASSDAVMEQSAADKAPATKSAKPAAKRKHHCNCSKKNHATTTSAAKKADATATVAATDTATTTVAK